MQNLKEIVKPFYTELLTANSPEKVQEVINALIADNFQHINTFETHDKSQFRKHITGVMQLIPDMKTEIQEMLEDGNRVVVRSVVTGKPKGNFFGVETDGTKEFSVMAIDIHTIENNQITKIYHLEEWTTAFGQLQSGKEKK